MLTRLVRNQLVIFAIASIIGLSVMVFTYLQAPLMLGIGQIQVKLELPRSGGIYQFSNVTYRGVQVGKVADVTVRDGNHVEATLSLDTSPKIPVDLTAAVRSVSAVGEQYVDLQPRNESAPYLHDGSVIPKERATVPQQVGPMLDQINALVGSLPKDRLSDVLDESFKAFNGTGRDIGSLLDSSATLGRDLNSAADQTRALVDDSVPLLDGQAQSTEALRTWAHSLAGVTGQITNNDPQLRTILQRGPDSLNQVSRLLNDLKPTLPVLLANLTTIGQVGVTYHASLEQLLVLLPPSIATTQASSAPNNPTGLPLGDFSLSIGDPPACNIGFLPPSQWRSPADVTDIDTPDGLYCKLPQDSPLNVRGARNYPCMGKPGKRAPTVQICESDKPFEPLALRSHALGPGPIDPNTLAQGIAPDERVGLGDNLYGPLDGTAPPPAAVPPAPQEPAPSEGTAQIPDLASTPTPEPEPDPAQLPATGGAPVAAPSSFSGAGPETEPSLAVAHYNRETGAYMGPDGHMYRQSDLVSTDRSWTDLVLSPS